MADKLTAIQAVLEDAERRQEKETRVKTWLDKLKKISFEIVDVAHDNDSKSTGGCLGDPFVDVNFVGTVCLKSKKTEIVAQGESTHEVRVEYNEFKTQITALFLAAHSGNLAVDRKLLSYGTPTIQRASVARQSSLSSVAPLTSLSSVLLIVSSTIQVVLPP